MAIDPALLSMLSQVAPADPSRAAPFTPATPELAPFGDLLKNAAEAVVAPHQAAAQAIRDFTQGAEGELHKTMLTVERSDIALKYFVSIRNRCLEAYREVMRMGS